jgi:hypothetical protein
MYLVIWYWLVLLMLVSLPYILFRISTIVFDNVRFALIMSSGKLFGSQTLPFNYVTIYVT